MSHPETTSHPLELQSGNSALRVQSPLYGGSFTTSTTTTLPYVLPNELVQLTPHLEILEPSRSRTQPACAHFGTCGAAAATTSTPTTPRSSS